MKKNLFLPVIIFILLFLEGRIDAYAQQLPYYSQFRSNIYMINPGVTGTKRLVDARLNYRNQWVGYDQAPVTESFSMHSRLMQGKMGIGFYMMADKVGPAKQMNLGASYAYHVRFPDCELSAGLSGVATKYTLTGNKITIHNTQDPSIDQFITNSTWVYDANLGIYLYNDRFQLGLSGLHALQSEAEFYKKDTIKKGIVRYASHINGILGYNFSQNRDYVFENNLYCSYVFGMPLMIDYTMRVHYMEKIFVGASLRLRDAVAIHVGATFFDYFQVSYSYDLLISKFKSYSSGSHEIMLTFSSDIFRSKHGKKNGKFLHQKYAYMF